MSDRTQDLKNLRAVATACKNYVDATKEQILWQVGQYNITTQDDNTIAYQKTVPTGATRAKIKSIGGMSYKCNNLFDKDSYNYSNKYYNSVGGLASATDNSMHDEAITVLPNTKYTFSVNTAQAFLGVAFFNDSTFISKSQVTNTTSITFTTPNNCNKVYFNTNYNSQAISADYLKTIEPMLNVGETALPYEPYFEGIRDSAITSVKSYDSNNNLIDTYTIPSEIQALEGYGRGINENCYNVLDFETKEFTDKDNTLDMGTLTYSKSPSGLFQGMPPSDIKHPSVNTKIPNLLSAIYEVISSKDIFGPQSATPSPNMVMALSVTDYLFFNNTNYTDVTAFKTAMDGVNLQYELATYDTTNNLELPDNVIEVEAGGYLVFENQYGQAVPSNITYRIEVAK